jgi:hypothetical protein
VTAAKQLSLFDVGAPAAPAAAPTVPNVSGWHKATRSVLEQDLVERGELERRGGLVRAVPRKRDTRDFLTRLIDEACGYDPERDPSASSAPGAKGKPAR